MRRTTWAPLFAAVVAVGGCIGQIGDGPGDGGRSAAVAPPREGLAPSGQRRLGRFEYERTLRDLVGDAAVDAAAVALAALPSDQEKDGFSTTARGLSAVHVEAYFRVADAVGAFVAADTLRRAALAPCLGDAVPTEACVRGFVERFGRRAWRRPLASEETAALVATYDKGRALSVVDGVHLLLLRLLQDPAFVYRLEIAGPATTEAEVFALDAHELATRLAYLAWGSAPDDALLDAAATGGLDVAAGLAGELERLFGDQRAERRVAHFFAEWLHLDRIPPPDQSEAFLDGIAPDALVVEARREIEALALHHVFDDEGGVAALFGSPVALPGSPTVGEIYGLEAGAAELPPERAGLLTRVGMLMGTGETTHPIQRGALVRRRLLCDPIDPPSPNAFGPGVLSPPAFDASKTARQRWSEKTEQGGCAGCHGRINPIGFALEGFDTLGRERDTEPVVDPASGTVVGELPIDTAVAIDLGDGAPVSVEGARALSRAMAESDAVHACFAKQWLRYAEGRAESPEDEALLAALVAAGRSDTGGLGALFTEIARRPGFRLHRRAASQGEEP
jgi:hypothetical protein